MYAKTNAFTRERERVKHPPFKFTFFVWLGVISLIFQNLFLFSNSLIVKAEEPKVETKQEEKSELLQFTSNGSVVGFNNEGVIVASKDKALKIGFVNPNKVTPTQESSTVTYTNLWEGVNVTYEQTSDSIFKSTYYLNNSDKVNNILLAYNRPVTLDTKGNLIIKFETGTITEQAPTAYQQTPQGKHTVDVSFKFQSNNTVAFTISNFLPNLPIVIDPALTWNTFLGTSGNDSSPGIDVDTSGNIYITGSSTATWGSPIRAYTSGTDAFVAKLDNNGNLTWNTFLGGSGTDAGYGVTVDSSGNIYTSGYSSATWGSPVRAYTSGNDVFVAKLDNNGNLTWNTFLGTSGSDAGWAIALDTSGNIYTSGQSAATWGSPVRAYTSGTDGFVAKLDSSGVLTWNTFLGGSGTDAGYGVTVDSSGNIYTSGYSTATWGGSPVNAYTSGTDAFVAKLDNDGALTWNTFLGGSGTDQPLTQPSIVIDSIGNIYTSGYSTATWGTPIRTYDSGFDDFLVKLDGNGNLTWNTFLGGSGTDVGYGVTVDASDNIYTNGYSTATWGTPVRSYTSGNDVFVVKLEGFPSISGITSGVGDSGTTISWTTDIVSSSKVDYGTTTAYGSSTTETDTSTRVTSHSVTLSGLSTCTTYHYRVRSKDAGSTEGVSSDYSFVSQGCSGSPNTPEVYQVSSEMLQTITAPTTLSPAKDSNPGEQKVVAIIPPKTFNFNAFLSSQVTNTIYSGNLTSVGKVQEIWYKAYAPEGYSPAKIVPSVQQKESIISLSYQGNYKNLKIAHSTDGKHWKILPNSVIDTTNKTVAAITKLGGYYTLVVNPATSKTTVLGTTIQQTPLPTKPPDVIDTQVETQEAVQKETILTKIIEFIKKMIINIRK